MKNQTPAGQLPLFQFTPKRAKAEPEPEADPTKGITEHKTIICPFCKSRMKLRTTWKFKYKNGDPRRFYGCSRYPHCKAIVGAHPDGSPMGQPGDEVTRKARIEAHRLFDKIWKLKIMSRKQAYSWLANQLERPEAEVHFAKMDAGDCGLAVRSIVESGILGDRLHERDDESPTREEEAGGDADRRVAGR